MSKSHTALNGFPEFAANLPESFPRECAIREGMQG
jgi:hypothetical protein